MAHPPIKLAVLASGGGTTLQNLIDRIAAGQLDARVAVVIASRPGIMALQRAVRRHPRIHRAAQQIPIGGCFQP